MRKLLAIGINDYDFSPLEGCDTDAKAFAELMKYNGDGSQNFHIQVADNVPNKGGLNRLIRNLFKGEGTTAVLYFSGHGLINENGSYIVAPDYHDDDEGVSMESILDIVNRSKIQDKIIILDCCHSGAFGSSSTAAQSLALISKGTVILSACSGDEAALQMNGRGLFTKLLMEALDGGAADLAGGITPGSVYAYIDRALGPFDGQRPVFKTNVSRFTLLRRAVPQIERKALEQLPLLFGSPDFYYPLTPEYEETNYEDSKDRNIRPYCTPEKVRIFKALQKMQSVGLVAPDAEFMYRAAMDSTGCMLTVMGKQYWHLIKEFKLNYI